MGPRTAKILGRVGFGSHGSEDVDCGLLGNPEDHHQLRKSALHFILMCWKLSQNFLNKKSWLAYQNDTYATY
jgi:hypothetical protein